MANHQGLVFGPLPNDLDNEIMNLEELLDYLIAILLVLLVFLLLLPVFLLLVNLGFFAPHLVLLGKFIERL